MARRFRFLEAEARLLRGGRGGMWQRMERQDVSLSFWGVESARNRARLESVWNFFVVKR